jgi:hypothetical protein
MQATALFVEEFDTANSRYTPMAVPQNKQITER